MHTLSQWIHQHDYLIGGGTVFIGSALFMAYCRGRIRWWMAWAGALSLFVGSIILLRTPDATISSADANTGGEIADESSLRSTEVINLRSVGAIEEMIRSVGKPVLVEIYADFGHL
jgi:hypothetical protein